MRFLARCEAGSVCPDVDQKTVRLAADANASFPSHQDAKIYPLDHPDRCHHLEHGHGDPIEETHSEYGGKAKISSFSPPIRLISRAL